MQLQFDIFFNKLEEIINSQLPFVVYRKPNEDTILLRHQNTTQLFELNKTYQNGFVFAPFSKVAKSIFFPFKHCEKFSTTFEAVNFNTKSKYLSDYKQITNLEEAKIEHIKLVKKGINYINENNAEKIVLSRQEIVEVNNINGIEVFKKMLMLYANAFVYVWFHPKIGMWLGATPERLFTLTNTSFSTMALAGTQLIKNSEINVVWEEKEVDEQKYVTDYILNALKNCVDLTDVKGPFSHKAGKLLHLRTDISGKLKPKTNVIDLINMLHPTPAVCGLPKNSATNFILKHEGYNRAYYTGYLGELNTNTTNLFVNLRCMELKNSKVSIYVGGGITKDSIPENEWEETVSKSETIKLVIT